jgi:site-specific DNA-methyltransferase (adenine-specific)
LKSIATKKRAPANRTLELSAAEFDFFDQLSVSLHAPVTADFLVNKIICQDLYQALPFLPHQWADLIFIDPPYNLNKTFDTMQCSHVSTEKYMQWLESWLPQVIQLLRPDGSLYICGDWKSSGALALVLEKYLIIRNRITFEREKGRGALRNWKNCSEDIWFATKSHDYYFDAAAVKLRRKVLAPYRENGNPKDWQKDANGNFRMTFPSNIWTDITIPFWSMPENTIHPTQKPEKLLAKIILASSAPGDLIFDPFAGVGTTAVTALKLNRNYCGIEISKQYCALAQKRLILAENNPTIQGYEDGVFQERNAQK